MLIRNGLWGQRLCGFVTHSCSSCLVAVVILRSSGRESVTDYDAYLSLIGVIFHDSTLICLLSNYEAKPNAKSYRKKTELCVDVTALKVAVVECGGLENR